MVRKISAFKNNDGIIIEIDTKNIIEAYKTSSGEIFLSELDAYKHEVDYLSNNNSSVIINSQIIHNKIEIINGVEIPKTIKQYSLSELFVNSCESIKETPGIYIWVNVYEKMPYCGSANNLRERVKNFVNSKNECYAGKKINEIRKKYINVHNLVWKLLIIEEDVEKDDLLKKESFYINKFNSINCGYNIMNPLKIEKEDAVKKYQIELIKQGYNGFLHRIKNWGLTTNIELEDYSSMYFINKKYPSFRLLCFINKKNIIEKNDLISAPRYFIDLIDNGRNGFRNKEDKIPSSLIRYRVYDNSYIPLCNTEIKFNNAIEALKYQIENYREKALNSITDKEYEKYYKFIQKCSIEDFIDLMFHDTEKLKDFISKKEKTENIFESPISKNVKKYYYETLSAIKKFNLKISDNITLENYANIYNAECGYRTNERPYPSFRLSSFINNKKIIGIEDFVYLPYGICKYIDYLKEWNFITTDIGVKIPDFMKYNHGLEKYTVIGLSGIWFDTPKEAIIKYLDKIIEKFKAIINNSQSNYISVKESYTYDDKMIKIINSMDYDMLIKLMFNNPEEIIKIIKS